MISKSAVVLAAVLMAHGCYMSHGPEEDGTEMDRGDDGRDGVRDDAGQLVAYAGRAVDDELAARAGKYRLPEGFKKSFVLFNLHRAKDHAERGLIVVEGFFDCFRVHQAGFANVVALMGSTLPAAQERLLVAHSGRLALMFDGDEAGTKCLRDFYARLRLRTYLREIHPEAGEQPDNLTEDRVRVLLS